MKKNQIFFETLLQIFEKCIVCRHKGRNLIPYLCVHLIVSFRQGNSQ